MRRREFMAFLGGAALAWPLAARAQQPTAPLIGFLSSRSPEESAGHAAACLQGLKAFGYVDGKTATVEYRWAKGAYERLPALAEETCAGLRDWLKARNGGGTLRSGNAPTKQGAPLKTIARSASGESASCL